MLRLASSAWRRAGSDVLRREPDAKEQARKFRVGHLAHHLVAHAKDGTAARAVHAGEGVARLHIGQGGLPDAACQRSACSALNGAYAPHFFDGAFGNGLRGEVALVGQRQRQGLLAIALGRKAGAHPQPRLVHLQPKKAHRALASQHRAGQGRGFAALCGV